MHEFKRRRGGGSERRDFVNVFFGARRYIGGREWWYAVPDAFRSTPSFYIYTFILFMKNNQTLFKIDFWTTLLRRASSPRRRVESSSSTLYIYIYIERERDSRDFCALRLYYYHQHHHHHRFIEAARGASSMDFDAPQSSSSSGTLILKCSMIASIFRSSFSVR